MTNPRSLMTAKDMEDEAGPYSLQVSADNLRTLGDGKRRDGVLFLKSWLESETKAHPVSGPTERPECVRMAKPADEAAVLALMMQDVRENALPIAEPDESRVMDHIRMGTRRMGGILGVIDGPDGKPVASILLLPFQWWWSRAYFLQEVWCYVHPDHRSSKHAINLMHFARWASDNMTREFGYRVWMFQGVTARTGARSKVRFYSRFTNYIGAFFIYPNPGGGV